jgi:hypothetical protein
MRLLGYLWALPVTVVGLLLVLLTCVSGGSVRFQGGIVEGYGGFVGWFLRGGHSRSSGAAMTLGHVVLARDRDCLTRSHPHELAHVRQFERWGVFLLPAYWLVSVWLRWRGYHPYLDNPFEPPPS